MAQEIQTLKNPEFQTTKEDLEQIFKALSTMIDESTFTIDSEGLTFRGMDPAHVALIDIRMNSNCFEIFETRDQVTKFAVRTDEFLKIIKTLDKKGSVKVEIKRDTIDIYQNGFNVSVKRLEESATDTPLPKMEYNSVLKFTDPLNMVKTLKKIESTSGYITIDSTIEKVILSGSSDNSKGSIVLLQGDQVTILNNKDSKCNYSLEYILPFLKSLNKETKMSFEYSQERPLRIQTSVGFNGVIDFYLAPRIEN